MLLAAAAAADVSIATSMTYTWGTHQACKLQAFGAGADFVMMGGARVALSPAQRTSLWGVPV